MGKSKKRVHPGRKVLRFVKEHSLTLALLSILIVQLAAYWFQGLSDWRSEQRAHDEAATIWPDYVTHYMAEVWLSSLADTYGAVILVLLTKYFWERGSAESKK